MLSVTHYFSNPSEAMPFEDVTIQSEEDILNPKVNFGGDTIYFALKHQFEARGKTIHGMPENPSFEAFADKPYSSEKSVILSVEKKTEQTIKRLKQLAATEVHPDSLVIFHDAEHYFLAFIPANEKKVILIESYARITEVLDAEDIPKTPFLNPIIEKFSKTDDGIGSIDCDYNQTAFQKDSNSCGRIVCAAAINCLFMVTEKTAANIAEQTKRDILFSSQSIKPTEASIDVHNQEGHEEALKFYNKWLLFFAVPLEKLKTIEGLKGFTKLKKVLLKNIEEPFFKDMILKHFENRIFSLNSNYASLPTAPLKEALSKQMAEVVFTNVFTNLQAFTEAVRTNKLNDGFNSLKDYIVNDLRTLDTDVQAQNFFLDFVKIESNKAFFKKHFNVTTFEGFTEVASQLTTNVGAKVIKYREIQAKAKAAGDEFRRLLSLVPEDFSTIGSTHFNLTEAVRKVAEALKKLIGIIPGDEISLESDPIEVLRGQLSLNSIPLPEDKDLLDAAGKLAQALRNLLGTLPKDSDDPKPTEEQASLIREMVLQEFPEFMRSEEDLEVVIENLCKDIAKNLIQKAVHSKNQQDKQKADTVFKAVTSDFEGTKIVDSENISTLIDGAQKYFADHLEGIVNPVAQEYFLRKIKTIPGIPSSVTFAGAVKALAALRIAKLNERKQQLNPTLFSSTGAPTPRKPEKLEKTSKSPNPSHDTPKSLTHLFFFNKTGVKPKASEFKNPVAIQICGVKLADKDVAQLIKGLKLHSDMHNICLEVKYDGTKGQLFLEIPAEQPLIETKEGEDKQDTVKAQKQQATLEMMLTYFRNAPKEAPAVISGTDPELVALAKAIAEDLNAKFNQNRNIELAADNVDESVLSKAQECYDTMKDKVTVKLENLEYKAQDETWEKWQESGDLLDSKTLTEYICSHHASPSA